MGTSDTKGLLEFCYETDMAASYLVVKTGERNILQHYQVEMMVNNRIPGVLPFDTKNKNGETFLYYNITSRLPMTYFIKRGVKSSHLIDMLASISEILIRSGDYLLSNMNFVFDENYIFVNPSTFESHMTYLPVKDSGNTLEVFREFVTRIISSSSYITENSCDNFVERILSYIKRKDFNIVDFARFLRGLSSKNAETQSNEKQYHCTHVDIGGNDKSKLSGIEKQSKNTEKKELRIMKFRPIRIAIGVFLQGFVVALMFTLPALLKPLCSDTLSLYAGTGVILAALDLLVLKRLFDKKFRITPTSIRTEKNSLMEMKGSELKADCSGHKTEDKHQEEFGIINNARTAGKVDVGEGSKDTVLLGSSAEGKPCLRCVKDGVTEEISITGPEFVIGRLKEQVDYVTDNNAVGKIHAVIIERNGNYFIKDMNTRNGTFVNETRLESNIEYSIKNNDRVRLANRDYIFTM